jgi:branched-chain amino acid transport system permease protein
MFLQLAINGVVLGSVYAIIALGFSLIYGATRIFHFAHGGIYACSAYIAYIFLIRLGFPLGVAIPASMFFTALLGVFLDWIVYEPLIDINASPLVLMISSLGLFIVMENVLALIFGSDPLVMRLGEVKEGIRLGTAYVTPSQVHIVLSTVLMSGILVFFFKKTRMGVSVRALASNPDLAESLGMDVKKIRYITFAVGSALAAVASVLVSIDVSTIDPVMGFNAILMATFAIIVGGVGNIPAAAGGGFLLGVAQHFGIWKISSEWEMAILFLILFIFIIFRPKGLLGKGRV